jgi:hypothetical protein
VSVINFIKGSTVIGTGSLFTQSTTDVPSQYGYTSPNNPNFTYTATFSDILTVQASTSYKSTVKYLAGLRKNDNKGNQDSRSFATRSTSAPQSAENTGFDSSSSTITGIYPYFWGTSATLPTTSGVASTIQSGGSTKVVASSTGNITISFLTSGSKYLWFATPATSATKTTWFISSLNSGSIGGPSNLFASASTTTVTSPNSYWSGISYKIYISNYDTDTESDSMLIS